MNHALKVLLPEQKVKRDHNQTIKDVITNRISFSSAGKIGIPVKWIAFWLWVSGEIGKWWTTSEHILLTFFFRFCFECPDNSVWFKAWNLQKGTKRLHKNGDSYDRLLCVQVQCTLSECQLLCALVSNQMKMFSYVHCTLCEEKREDEPNSGVQQCSAVFGSHAKCIHFTGIYSMLSIKTGWEVHNDIQRS